VDAYRQAFHLNYDLPYPPSPRRLPAWAATAQLVPHRIKRDIEQLEYLVSKTAVSKHLSSYITDFALPEYRKILNHTSKQCKMRGVEFISGHPTEDLSVFYGLYDKALNVHPGLAIPGSVINPKINFKDVNKEYWEKEHRVVVIDEFLTEVALEQLSDYVLESTIWTQAKTGYVGAYMHSGFACPLVAQISDQIKQSLPELLGNLELKDAWAYMFDGTLGGINVHADDAQVQVNIFLTPSEANLWIKNNTNPSGGLVIYEAGPPAEWAFDQYNSVRKNPRILNVVAAAGRRNMTVPYIRNRAILFESTYFHKTDNFKFKKGYKNRRINVTFLFGKRSKLHTTSGSRTLPKSSKTQSEHCVEGSSCPAKI